MSTKEKSVLTNIRKNKPLIYHITNVVTVNDCALITRYLGALPVMANAPEEAADMTKISQALVINIGTLTKEQIEAMHQACQQAEEQNIPIVLDAVGAGATPYRTETALQLIQKYPFTVIKGNAGEIATLAGSSSEVKGVESISITENPLSFSRKLAQETKSTIAITGPEDLVVSRQESYRVKNGHPLMGEIVGTGCMSSSVIGSFLTINPFSPSYKTALALACFGVAGEMAAQKAQTAPYFKTALMDSLYSLNSSQLLKNMKIEKIEDEE